MNLLDFAKRLFCWRKGMPHAAEATPFAQVENPRAADDRRLLGEFFAQHGDLNERFRYCPLSGRALNWRISVTEVAPFDMKTGAGVRTVSAEMSMFYRGYLHYYDQESKRMKIWDGAHSEWKYFA